MCTRTHDHVAICPQGVLSPCHPLRAPPFRHSHHLKHLGWRGALGADGGGADVAQSGWEVWPQLEQGCWACEGLHEWLVM